MHSSIPAFSAPLAGIRVVAIEHSVAGPLSTRILGELGAEVIKIERPGSGDFARHWDQNVAGESAQFWWLNTEKKSVALDLKSDAGRAALADLLADTDVLVQNLAPASASRLGLGADNLAEMYPRLINCQISGYGADGPDVQRKAYDMLIQAESGIMSITGTADQPMRVGVSISDVSTGLYAAILVLGALHERERSGRGRFLDLAMLDASIEFVGPMLLSYANAGVLYPRIPDRHHAISPYGVFECSDNERVLIAVEQDSEWQRFCLEVLGDPDLYSDERYASNVRRVEHGEQLASQIATHLKTRSSAEVLGSLAEAGLAYAKINTVGDVYAHPVVAHRGIIDTALNAEGKTVHRHVGLVTRAFGLEPDGIARPPRLGEHTEELQGGSLTPDIVGRGRDNAHR